MKPGEQISDQIYLVADKDLRSTTNGGLYIHAILRDRTGEVLSRMWQASEELFKEMDGGFIRIRGRTESYKGNLQLIVDGLEAVPRSAIDISEFLPATTHDIEQMWQRVLEILRTVKDPDLLQLVRCFVEDAEMVDCFKRAPAAIKMHHAYIGGLLEHTLNLLELAVVVVPRYPELSLDLILVGLFLHDIGKTAELGYEVNFTYTDGGQLVGHIAQCVIWIEQKAAQVATETGKPFPPEKKYAIQHIVLSHHGQYEYGSPKLPATPEAFCVHHLDVMDAKINQALAAIAKDKDDDAVWTNYLPALGTKIYKRDVVPEGN